MCVLEIKQHMHKCQKRYLVDLDTKLMTSVGQEYKQHETRSRYCGANDNLCNVRRYCKLLMLQQCGGMHGAPIRSQHYEKVTRQYQSALIAAMMLPNVLS
jgi:hypothetical protein